MFRLWKVLSLYCETCKVRNGEKLEGRGQKKPEKTHYLRPVKKTEEAKVSMFKQ